MTDRRLLGDGALRDHSRRRPRRDAARAASPARRTRPADVTAPIFNAPGSTSWVRRPGLNLLVIEVNRERAQAAPRSVTARWQ
jgi:hypothetical protein